MILYSDIINIYIYICIPEAWGYINVSTHFK